LQGIAAVAAAGAPAALAHVVERAVHAVVAPSVVGLGLPVVADRRTRRAGDDAERAGVRVGHTALAHGAGVASARGVANPVGAAAAPRRLERVVVADHRPGRAAGDARVAGVGVVVANHAGGAVAAVAVAVADHVGAAADAAHLGAAVSARHRARRAGIDAVPADAGIARAG